MKLSYIRTNEWFVTLKKCSYSKTIERTFGIEDPSHFGDGITFEASSQPHSLFLQEHGCVNPVLVTKHHWKIKVVYFLIKVIGKTVSVIVF